MFAKAKDGSIVWIVKMAKAGRKCRVIEPDSFKRSTINSSNLTPVAPDDKGFAVISLTQPSGRPIGAFPVNRPAETTLIDFLSKVDGFLRQAFSSKGNYKIQTIRNGFPLNSNKEVAKAWGWNKLSLESMARLLKGQSEYSMSVYCETEPTSSECVSLGNDPFAPRGEVCKDGQKCPILRVFQTWDGFEYSSLKVSKAELSHLDLSEHSSSFKGSMTKCRFEDDCAALKRLSKNGTKEMKCTSHF